MNDLSRAVNAQSFFTDPDPVIFCNADPDPALKTLQNITLQEFSEVKSWSKCTVHFLIKLQLLPISLHFSVFSS